MCFSLSHPQNVFVSLSSVFWFIFTFVSSVLEYTCHCIDICNFCPFRFLSFSGKTKTKWKPIRSSVHSEALVFAIVSYICHHHHSTNISRKIETTDPKFSQDKCIFQFSSQCSMCLRSILALHIVARFGFLDMPLLLLLLLFSNVLCWEIYISIKLKDNAKFSLMMLRMDCVCVCVVIWDNNGMWWFSDAKSLMILSFSLSVLAVDLIFMLFFIQLNTKQIAFFARNWSSLSAVKRQQQWTPLQYFGCGREISRATMSSREPKFISALVQYQKRNKVK